jgi:acylphosphatase
LIYKFNGINTALFKIKSIKKMEQALEIIVAGKVHGVFYRKSTLKKANELSLKGWVKNKANGTVQIKAQGQEPNLKELLNWCHQGPEAARVEKVTSKPSQLQQLEGFKIVR